MEGQAHDWSSSSARGECRQLERGAVGFRLAETCVTGVNPTFANAVSGITGNPGTTVVTAVTPTMTSALTNVTANPGAVRF